MSETLGRATTRIGALINLELEQAKDALQALSPAVSIYGGARIRKTDPFYARTVQLAKALSELGVHVISGGGPGIMEAANLGASLGKKGRSIGLNIELPSEQKPNAYQNLSLSFDTFAARKVAFCAYSEAFIVMPGGVGTLDELFEVLTLIQTGKMPEIPVILYGSSYWAGLLVWMRNTVLAEGLMDAEDLDKRIHMVDSTERVLQILESKGIVPPPNREPVDSSEVVI